MLSLSWGVAFHLMVPVAGLKRNSVLMSEQFTFGLPWVPRKVTCTVPSLFGLPDEAVAGNPAGPDPAVCVTPPWSSAGLPALRCDPVLWQPATSVVAAITTATAVMVRFIVPPTLRMGDSLPSPAPLESGHPPCWS